MKRRKMDEDDTAFQKETKIYLALPLINIKSSCQDVLDWWKVQKGTLLCLASAARKYLSIPDSSA